MIRRQLPIGVPRDYLELGAVYGRRIRETAARAQLPIAVLAERLRSARTVESFIVDEHLPSTFTWDEARAFLGCKTDTTFRDLLLKTSRRTYKGQLPWSTVRPYTTNSICGAGPAKADDRTSVFWGPDILRLADFLDQHQVVRQQVPECQELVRSFGAHFEAVLADVTPELRPAPVVEQAPPKKKAAEWPKDLPRNYDELAAMYTTYIGEQVRRVSKNKSEEELREVYQQVWYNLLNSRLLEHFFETAKSKLPRTLTLADSLGYLGVTFDQWKAAVEANQKDPSEFWLPKPIKGEALDLSDETLFLTEDIQTLDASGFLADARGTRQHPEFSGRGFKSYLTRAVRNHFYNLLRTRRRRHKERGVAANVVLTNSTAGTYHKAYVSEDGFQHWEDQLVDSGDVSMEDMLDLKATLDRNGVDPLTLDGQGVLDSMSFGAMTVREALRKQQKVRAVG